MLLGISEIRNPVIQNNLVQSQHAQVYQYSGIDQTNRVVASLPFSKCTLSSVSPSHAATISVGFVGRQNKPSSTAVNSSQTALECSSFLLRHSHSHQPNQKRLSSIVSRFKFSDYCILVVSAFLDLKSALSDSGVHGRGTSGKDRFFVWITVSTEYC